MIKEEKLIINKEYIKNNLIKKDGTLNGVRIKKINYTPEELFLIYCSIDKPTCDCGVELKFNNFRKGFYLFCSVRCVNKNPDIQKKIKQTKLDKYNNENYNNRDLITKTCLNKYGYKTASESKIVKEKISKSSKNGCEKVIKKKQKTCLNKYGYKMAIIKKIKNIL